MGKRWIAAVVAVPFFVVSFLILLDQYVKIGIWFQSRDIHHETLALIVLAVGIGILIGAVISGTEDDSKNRP